MKVALPLAYVVLISGSLETGGGGAVCVCVCLHDSQPGEVAREAAEGLRGLHTSPRCSDKQQGHRAGKPQIDKRARKGRNKDAEEPRFLKELLPSAGW